MCELWLEHLQDGVKKAKKMFRLPTFSVDWRDPQEGVIEHEQTGKNQSDGVI